MREFVSPRSHLPVPNPSQARFAPPHRGLLPNREPQRTEPGNPPPILHEAINIPVYPTHQPPIQARLKSSVNEAGHPLESDSRTGLPRDVQAKMETAFTANFSDVRVHPASRSANALGVEAFTRANNIHFASGFYQPRTPSGQALIGHELAHVIQQRQGRVTATMQACGYPINDNRALESEAERLGDRAARGESATMTGANPATPSQGQAVPIQASGIELLKSKDPAPGNTDELKDWPTLKASAANPTDVNLHQILLTYEKLSDGWKSGMGEVLQALSNKYSENQAIPTSEISYGASFKHTINVSKIVTSKPQKKKKEPGKRKDRKGEFKAKPVPELKSEKFHLDLFRGTLMKADLLTPKGPAGSDATKGAYVNYGSAVEGHLLNAHLHGPAEYKNLAPFSSKLNKKHSSIVEEPLKKMIYNQGKYFSYQVKVNDGTDKKDQGFYPASINCDVVEVDAAKQAVPNGYEHHVTIDQQGNISETGTKRIGAAPAKDVLMNFNAQVSASDASKGLAALWNKLKFPWKRSYGEVIDEVLKTAYTAVRNYEQAHGAIGMTEKLALPQTVVTYTTGSVTNSYDEHETIGVQMVAAPLTIRPPASGEFGYEPEGDKWGLGAVKGHLLNHHLHGPAAPKNLAPMSNSLNQQFERDAESPLKKMVLTEGRVVRFEVKMTGSIERFGFDNAPENLQYQIKEYKPKGSAGDLEDIANWKLEAKVLKTGTLFNTEGGASVSEEYVDD